MAIRNGEMTSLTINGVEFPSVASVIKTVMALHEGIKHVEVIEHPVVSGKLGVRVHVAQEAPGSRALWATEIRTAVKGVVAAGIEVMVELHPYSSTKELDLVARVQGKVRALWGTERDVMSKDDYEMFLLDGGVTNRHVAIRKYNQELRLRLADDSDWCLDREYLVQMLGKASDIEYDAHLSPKQAEILYEYIRKLENKLVQGDSDG